MARKVTPAESAALVEVLARLDDAAGVPRPELAAAARTACRLLAERHPGHTVELRVPPVAAVQLGVGDRGAHTRGTPPNVVETDALTLLRLAGGSLGWPEALSLHLVRASGVHSGLAGVFPLALAAD